MNFDFSEAQYMLRDNIRSFLQGEWSVAKVRAAAETRGFDARLWSQLTELGVPALLVPEQHGGMGMNFVDAVLILEEFGRGLVPGAMIQTLIGSELIARFGSAALRDSLLPAVVGGSAVLAIASSEPAAGYDLEDIRMAARPTATGWQLSGTKILVPFADSATHLIVVARETGGALGLFICDAQQDGVAFVPHRLIDPGTRMCEVSCDVQIAAEHRLAEGNADAALASMVALQAAAATAEMIGAAARAFDIALDYVKLREQFGQPIGAFQAIKHKFADMYTSLEAGRSALYFAAWAIAEDDPVRDQAVSTAKAFCGEACRLVCNESLQVHGGIGYTWDYDLHFFLKRIKALEYSHGDMAWHRERVMRAILARAAVK